MKTKLIAPHQTNLAPINGKLYLFKNEYGKIQISGLIYKESLWLTQAAIAELFDVQRPAITKHINNIYTEGELSEVLTSSKMEQTENSDSFPLSKGILYYNLDMIIAVGYRVNSKKATSFRIWATQILREYIQKGFALDDERLKEAKRPFGKDYFRELLERVRSIRTSERRQYQQITDIFAECSIDYDPNSDEAKLFYATIQNKFHYAIHAHTAPEIIKGRASLDKPYMGLTSWKNSPNGRVLKSDVSIAKNYLSENELKQLERIITMFFDYIEHQLEQENAFNMSNFALAVDKLLSFNNYKVLANAGQVSALEAKDYAEAIYDEFNKTQKIESDFDKLVKITADAKDAK
jgi:hypothetical protein